MKLFFHRNKDISTCKLEFFLPFFDIVIDHYCLYAPDIHIVSSDRWSYLKQNRCSDSLSKYTS